MSSCCGCWSILWQSLDNGTRRKDGRTYRRAKYNEKEYSIEFENLIEEEDFYAPPQHTVSDIERELLSKGKYDELLQHENDINAQKEEMLRQKEENVRLEDEAYIQAKKEASRVSRQSIKKQPFDKSKLPDMKSFTTSAEFSKWLSEENIDITSPELDIEDFDAFLERVKAKSAQAIKASGNSTADASFEQTLTRGLEATKIAGDAMNALQPVELHAVTHEVPVSDEQTSLVTLATTPQVNSGFVADDDEPLPQVETPVTTIVTMNTPRNIATNLNPDVTFTTPSNTSANDSTLSFKMVNPNERQISSILDDSLNDDDIDNDDEDDFVSANSNEGGFEELLT